LRADVGERSYLSIGDVLSLLREEFPDITISKIRFLESRGLLIPERTPSGYRKFYEHDVDRLRWILRQQRENFLPLKVIKGRLEGQEPSSEPTPMFEVDSDRDIAAPLEAKYSSHQSNGAYLRDERPPAEAGAVMARHSSMATAVPQTNAGTDELTPAVATIATARGPAADVQASEEATPGGARQASARATPGSRSASRSESPAGGGGGRTSARRPAGTQLPGPPSGAGTGSPAATADVDTTADVEAPVSGAGRSRDPGAEAGRATQSPQPGGPAPTTGGGVSSPRADGQAEQQPEAASLSGASFTAGELAHASGLEAAQIEELESYGLIESRLVAGVQCYDEDALVVSGLAAAFARFGVEARHLRLFKHAAERQASLYSQVVMPLLRQRNPDARRRAHDDLTRLNELGASMQACFAKAVLRDLTGG
jgi:DNA-binding transcriptional MerR regulator